MSSGCGGVAGSAGTGEVVVRDRERFKRFYPENRAVIPADAVGEIDPTITTRVLIGRRIRELQEAEARRAGITSR